jgi:uncharacterized membrane protein YkoI
MMLKKQNKKIMLAAALIIVLIGVGLAGMEINQINSRNKAKDAAQQYVSASAELVSVRGDDDSYTFKYFDAEQQERSEIEVDKKGRQILKIQTQKAADTASNAVALNEEALKEIVRNEVSGASIKEIIPSDRPEEKYITISFVAPDLCGAYLLDPANGSVLARTIKFGKSVAIPISSNSDNFSLLSLSQFKILGKQKVPGAVFQDLDIIYANGKFTAEIDLYLDGVKHELSLDASSGAELAYEFFEDDWKSYGSWEPRELETPLLNIVNYDVALAYSNTTIDTLPNMIPSESSSVIEPQPTEAEITASSVPSETTTTQPTTTSSIPSETTKPQPTTTSTSTTAMTTKITPTSAPKPTAAPKPSLISTERAKSLVLTRLPGAEFNDIDLDEDDGHLLYKGKAISGNTEVDFEIDAYTGTFIKWDVDINDD